MTSRGKLGNVSFQMATVFIPFLLEGSRSNESVVWIRAPVFKQKPWVTLQCTSLLVFVPGGGSDAVCGWITVLM